MKTAPALTLFLAALAAPALAQQQVTYTWSWREASGSNMNGVVEPGESVDVILRASFTPAVGTQITYTPPPGSGTGTVAGLALVRFDLVGECAANGGFWVLSGPGFGGTTGDDYGVRLGWMLGPAGNQQANGDVLDCIAGQMPMGPPANSSNPVVELWRGRWTPDSYTPRMVSFAARAASAAGTNHSGLLVHYDDDPNGRPLYTTKFVAGQFGSILIPIGFGGPVPCECYANCDGSVGTPALNINDYVCFQARFAAGDSYANCDNSTLPPVLNVNDFICFQARFAQGCQ